MFASFIIALYLLASLVALIYPGFALLLFWPLILFHPTFALYGKLPLNMGFDDMYLLCLFVGSLIKCGGRLKVGWPVVAAVVFCLLGVLGELSYVVTGAEVDASRVWKEILKSSGLILLVFSMSALITTPEQVRRVIYSLLLGALVGAIFVILYAINPDAWNPFQIPHLLLGRETWGFQAIGPFDSHDIAGGVLGFATLMGYSLIRFVEGTFRRLIAALIMGLLLLGLLLSGSRSGWVFVAFPVMLSSLLSKQRILGAFLLVLMAAGLLLSIAKFPYFSRRVEQTMTQAKTWDLQQITAGRYGVWKNTLAKANKTWLLFGEGLAQKKGEPHPHNNYIGMLKHMGLISIIFWFAYYKKIFARSSWLMKYDPICNMSAIFRGVFWAYIGYLLFFMTCTPIQWAPVRYIDFCLMTLVYLRYRQIETEPEYAFEDQLYPDQLSYDPVY